MNKNDPARAVPAPGARNLSASNLERQRHDLLPPPVPVITENQRLILLGLSEKTVAAIDIITDLLRIYRRVEEIVGPSAEMAEALLTPPSASERYRKTHHLVSLTSGKVPPSTTTDKDAAGPTPLLEPCFTDSFPLHHFDFHRNFSALCTN
ncbi:hypothetical protein HPP92_003375 [Vanilla planifolia]|uniref:Uncharacterized protein n=1 Tax=Vanilla planifolia TaxID=51239 RepID=A0A835RVP1_VANPL|nr:hypothetical protein HPP92_003745 [Vanilla planifolia]KAG0503303.1 hypothetical protein HPP92_003375 [Vanilla planifolia]